MKNYLKYLLFVLAVFSSEWLFAQLFVPSAATLHIEENASIAIAGRAENTGTFNNFGTTSLSGDWLNSGTYNTTGTFILNGADQIIDHDTLFNNLTIEGGGTKSIVSDIVVEGYLSLQNGVITPGSNATILMNTNASSSPGSDISYVNGTLYTKGLGDKYYPIGNSSGFYPAELHAIEGVNPTIGMTVFSSSTIPSTEGKISSTLDRYWQRSIITGSIVYATISLSLHTDDNIYDSLTIEVLQSILSDGTYSTIGNNPLVSSMIPLDYVSGSDTAKLEFFTLGSIKLVDWDTYYFPNALSNNAPGEEDQTVKLYGDVFEEDGFSLRISNNWGNIVFETTSLFEMQTTGWDGTNKRTGKRETTGQYNYILKAKVKDGTRYNDAGSIWILD